MKKVCYEKLKEIRSEIEKLENGIRNLEISKNDIICKLISLQVNMDYILRNESEEI
ncbi:MAG: hypothetical protein ACRDD7_03960 [Peptostreptococcaceae bacterium]